MLFYIEESPKSPNGATQERKMFYTEISLLHPKPGLSEPGDQVRGGVGGQRGGR